MAKNDEAHPFGPNDAFVSYEGRFCKFWKLEAGVSYDALRNFVPPSEFAHVVVGWIADKHAPELFAIKRGLETEQPVYRAGRLFGYAYLSEDPNAKAPIFKLLATEVESGAHRPIPMDVVKPTPQPELPEYVCIWCKDQLENCDCDFQNTPEYQEWKKSRGGEV